MKDILLLSFSSIVLLSAIFSLEGRKLLYSVALFSAFLTLFSVYYFYLGVEFLGVVQLLVYAGGVTVLMLFSLMLAPEVDEKLSIDRRRGLLSLLVLPPIMYWATRLGSRSNFPLLDTRDISRNISDHYVLVLLISLLVVSVILSISSILGGEKEK